MYARMVAQNTIREQSPRKHAAVIALTGDLGSGKTTFVKGFAAGLGIRRRMVSPTFLIIKRYTIPEGRQTKVKKMHEACLYRFLFHIDAYRLKKPRELLSLGWREIAENPQHLVLIEWAEKVRSLLPKASAWIALRHRKEGERIIQSYGRAKPIISH